MCYRKTRGAHAEWERVSVGPHLIVSKNHSGCFDRQACLCGTITTSQYILYCLITPKQTGNLLFQKTQHRNYPSESSEDFCSPNSYNIPSLNVLNPNWGFGRECMQILSLPCVRQKSFFWLTLSSRKKYFQTILINTKVKCYGKYCKKENCHDLKPRPYRDGASHEDKVSRRTLNSF